MGGTSTWELDLSRPELSLCMIVRDEQEMLPDFLASVAGLWDELVVADTGSRDQTVPLLEAAGAHIIHFRWIDDFAAARNASLEQATGRWILFLDADERPTPELGQQIRALLDDPDAGAATVIMRNEWPGGGRRDAPLLRLFRRDPSIRFQYRIHEDVSTVVRDYLQANHLHLRNLSGVVHHLGYARETALGRDKKNRDLELLRRSLDSDPRDFYCWFKILEIARFWDDQPLWQETAQTAARFLTVITDREKSDLQQRPFSGEFAALVAQGLGGGDEDRLRWLEASTGYCTRDSAWLLRHGLLLENLNRPEEAQQSFLDCLDHGSDNLIQVATVRPRLGLCRLAMARADMEAAARHANLACEDGPFDPEALLAAVTCLTLTEPERQPETFVARHLQNHPDAATELAKALLQTGKVVLAADILIPLAPNDTEAALGYLVCSLVLDREIDLQVDADQERVDALFKMWIHLLWQSRNSSQIEAFADNCGTVLEIFPWLQEFLVEETRNLRR